MSIPAKEDIDATKIAIERYRNVIGYLQYENTIYWTRTGLMLIAHSTLFGFLTKVLQEIGSKQTWFDITMAFSVSIVGLLLSILWTRLLEGSLWWIERWHQVLLDLEPVAYGAINVFRGVVGASADEGPHQRTRGIARQLAVLFRAIWIASLAYSLWAAWMHLCS